MPAHNDTTDFVFYSEANVRLDCLRALKAHELEQKVLARLASATSEGIPDELIVLIFEFLAQKVGIVQWEFGRTKKSLDKATRRALGTSATAKSLNTFMEEALLKNITHAIPVPQLKRFLEYPQGEVTRQLGRMRHLQLQVYWRPDGHNWNNPPGASAVGNMKDICNEISKGKEGQFPHLKTVGLQVIFVEPSRWPSMATMVTQVITNNRPNITGYHTMIEEMLSALQTTKDHVRKQKRTELGITFQLKLLEAWPRSLAGGKLEDDAPPLFETKTIDATGKSKDQVMFEAGMMRWDEYKAIVDSFRRQAGRR